jgi:hypothetical protein
MPVCRFDEKALRTTRKMVITAKKDISDGDEVTVKYDKQVPFVCLCGESNCVSRRKR